MKWTDTQEIARTLFDKHADVEPLAVRFTDMHRWICELDGFADPEQSTEGILEAIQMAWLDEWED